MSATKHGERVILHHMPLSALAQADQGLRRSSARATTTPSATRRPARSKRIDMGRRGLHNEAAEVLQEALAEHFTIDIETARRLFTLVCALHVRG